MRIAVIGKEGVGISSLVSAVMQSSIMPKPYELVNIPSFSPMTHDTANFLKVLEGYDAYVCAFDSKLSRAEVEIFRTLNLSGKPCVFVRTKSDMLSVEDLNAFMHEKDETLGDLQRNVHFDRRNALYFTCCKHGKRCFGMGLQELSRDLEQRSKGIVVMPSFHTPPSHPLPQNHRPPPQGKSIDLFGCLKGFISDCG